MALIATEEQLDDPEVILSVDAMVRRSTKPKVTSEGFSYTHTTDEAKKKAEADIPNKIAKGLMVTGYTYWIEVPTTTTGIDVPVGWPDRTITDPNDPDKTVSKRWNQYTCIVYGVNGMSLLLCEHQKKPKGIRDRASNAEIKKYVKLFGGDDTSSLIFGDTLAQWKLANTGEV